MAYRSKMFLSPQLHMQKLREPNHALSGVISHLFGKTWYNLLMYKIWQL